MASTRSASTSQVPTEHFDHWQCCSIGQLGLLITHIYSKLVTLIQYPCIRLQTLLLGPLVELSAIPHLDIRYRDYNKYLGIFTLLLSGQFVPYHCYGSNPSRSQLIHWVQLRILLVGFNRKLSSKSYTTYIYRM